MYRDFKKAAPVEVDTILGDLLERGQQHGLTTPILQATFVSLSIYQRGLDRARAASSGCSSDYGRLRPNRIRNRPLEPLSLMVWQESPFELSVE
jgi:hypothetical protein